MRNKTIARAALLLAIGTIFSKILGFVRELVVAYKFGAGSISDAFVITNGIPSIIFVSVGTAIGINYIPYFQRLRDDEEKNRFTSNLLNVLLVILIAGCLIIFLVPGLFLKMFAAGLNDQTEIYAVVMLRIVVFSIIPITVSHLFQAYSQAKGLFTTTAIYGLISNTVIIIMTLFATKENYWLLSIGTLVSNIAGMMVVLWGIRDSGYKYKPILKMNDSHIKEMALLSLPLIAEDIASGMSILVDRNLASFLDSGTVSGLGYAGTLSNIAGTMITTSIVTATFPSFSKLISENHIESFRETFVKYGEIILLLMCPISIIFIAFSKDIVIFVFQRGAFSDDATTIVYQSLICYAIGIVPNAMQSYYIRAFYSLQDTRTPAKIKVFALVCNIILNIATVKFFRHMGIAASTSLSMVISYILLGRKLKEKYHFHVSQIMRKSIFLYLMMGFFAGVLSYGIGIVFDFHHQTVRMIVELATFSLLYLGLNLIFNKKTVLDCYRMIRKK